MVLPLSPPLPLSACPSHSFCPSSFSLLLSLFSIYPFSFLPPLWLPSPAGQPPECSTTPPPLTRAVLAHDAAHNSEGKADKEPDEHEEDDGRGGQGLRRANTPGRAVDNTPDDEKRHRKETRRQHNVPRPALRPNERRRKKERTAKAADIGEKSRQRKEQTAKRSRERKEVGKVG